MSILVFKYGLRSPTVGADLVEEQLRLAHRYRNTLTEIVRGKREALRQNERAQGDALAPAEAEVVRCKAALDDALASQAKTRKATRSRSETVEQREAVAMAREALKLARSALATVRADLRASGVLQAEKDEIAERFNEMARNQRNVFGDKGTESGPGLGLRHGTYCRVEEAAKKADGDMPIWDGSEAQDPRFARWTGEGAVAAQIGAARNGKPGGRTWAELATDTFLRITPSGSSRGGRRQFAVLSLRVGSNPDRSPVWATWPMVMHQSLPTGARVTSVAVHKRRIGPRVEWSATLTMSVPDGALREGAPAGAGAVALDVGWRVIGDEVRVAAWAAEDGTTGELRLRRGSGVLGGLDRCDQIQSTRDVAFEAAKSALGGWLKSTTAEVPSWMRGAASYMHQWRSQARMGALVRRWSGARFAGDSDAFTLAEAWRYHDHHLWEWESEQRARAIRARKDLYRRWSADLARRFAVVVMEEDAGLKTFGRKATPESAAENETARLNMKRGAVGELRECLAHAFTVRGGRVAWIDGADTTRTCRTCGLVAPRPQAAESVVILCDCGAAWDQDDSAARVLLQRWSERPGGDDSAGVARKSKKAKKNAVEGETRRDRMARLRREKLTRMETAREAAAIAAE